MKRILRDNGLTIALLAMFAFAFGGQIMTGWAQFDEDSRAHGEAVIGLADYLRTGAFLEATFENWESEFLQMGAYVLLTVFLFQRGSSESKDPDGPDPVEQDPATNAGDPAALHPCEWVVWCSGSIRTRSSWRSLRSSRSLSPCTHRRSFGVQRGPAHPRGWLGHRPGVSRYLSVLVRVIPELAERNSWPWPAWWSFPSSCASATRPSRSRSTRPSPRPALSSQASGIDSTP